MRTMFRSLRNVVFVAGIFMSVAGCVTTPGPSVSTPASPVAAKIVRDPFVSKEVAAHEEQLRRSPGDAQALADYAFSLFNEAGAVDDPAQAQSLRRRAHTFASMAIAAGSDNLLMPLVLDEINPDGTLVARVLDGLPEVDALLKRGESHFNRGEMPEAVAAYEKALALDPLCYLAALFIADVAYAQKRYEESLDLFRRAIVIDPDRETAHRYRADALLRMRRQNEALEGYIEAIVADPYSKFTRAGLAQWAKFNGVSLHSPASDYPRGSISFGKDGKTVLNYNPDDGPSSLVYLLARAHWWLNDRPAEMPSAYRHSLNEEVAGLRLMLASSSESPKATEGVLEPPAALEAISFIRGLDKAGLLEAHVLLDRTDQGIAADYPTYRRLHRADIRRYIRTIWLGQSG